MFIETCNSAFDFAKSNCPFVCLTNHNRKVWKNDAINDIHTYDSSFANTTRSKYNVILEFI